MTPALIAARTKVQEGLMSFREEVDLFKPLLADLLPSIEEVTRFGTTNGSIYFDGKVTCFHNTTVMDAYLLKHDMEWSDAEQGELYGVAEAFGEKHNMHFYAECKEDFFAFKAAEEARREGKFYAVMDNLS